MSLMLLAPIRILFCIRSWPRLVRGACERPIEITSDTAVWRHGGLSSYRSAGCSSVIPRALLTPGVHLRRPDARASSSCFATRLQPEASDSSRLPPHPARVSSLSGSCRHRNQRRLLRLWRRMRPSGKLARFAPGHEPVPSTAGPGLNALLVAPIGVFPAVLGDPLRPFQIGLGPEILARRRPEVAVNICERAIRDYVRSFSYRHAAPQPDRCATTSTATRSSR